jgi:predicted carbohydrate-binding protein with CBM5 and CBM33 domain
MSVNAMVTVPPGRAGAAVIAAFWERFFAV